jgi:hypothetical protein
MFDCAMCDVRLCDYAAVRFFVIARREAIHRFISVFLPPALKGADFRAYGERRIVCGFSFLTLRRCVLVFFAPLRSNS